jgi:hypothetical protein
VGCGGRQVEEKDLSEYIFVTVASERSNMEFTDFLSLTDSVSLAAI